MKRTVSTILVLFLTMSFLRGQEVSTNTRGSIIENLQNFLDDVSEMNSYDPVLASNIASNYNDGYGFTITVNGVLKDDVSLEKALVYYNKTIMQNFNTIHRIEANEVLVTQEVNKLYRVECPVHRSRSCRQANDAPSMEYEDIVNMRFLVILDRTKKQEFQITSIDCDLPNDDNVLIGYQSDYTFLVPRDIQMSYLERTGVLLDDSVVSTEAKYPIYAKGSRGNANIEDSRFVKYDIWSDDLKVETKDGKHLVKVPYNDSRKSRKFLIYYEQRGSGKKYTRTILQEGNPNLGFFAYNASDNNSDAPIMAYHYGLKQPIGISIMLGAFKQRRWQLGFMGAFNLEVINLYSNNGKDQTEVTSSTVNGYKVTQTSYKHYNMKEYKDLLDPNGLARTKYRHFTALANVGYMLNNYLMAELGLGAAYSAQCQNLDKAYDLTVTEYSPLFASQPQIDAVYKYTLQSLDYTYKEKSTWSFASRMGARGFIPLGGTYQKWYICLGIGYNYVPGISRLNTFDFNIGIRIIQ